MLCSEKGCCKKDGGDDTAIPKSHQRLHVELLQQ